MSKGAYDFLVRWLAIKSAAWVLCQRSLGVGLQGILLFFPKWRMAVIVSTVGSYLLDQFLNINAEGHRKQTGLQGVLTEHLE